MAKVVVPLWCMSGSFMIFFIFKAGCGGLGGLRFCRENPNPDFRIQKRILRFWGANPKTDHESIKSRLRADSSDQTQIRIFEIHNLSVFLGLDLKEVFLTSGFSKKEMVRDRSRTCMTFQLNLCWWRLIFKSAYLSCFLYVCSVCLRRFIFQVIWKNNSSASVLNNSDNFTILRSVFYSRNVSVSNRNISTFRIFIRTLCCSFSRWASQACHLLSLFLCLSFALYSKFVEYTINLSLIPWTTRIQKQFPLSVFVLIDSTVVSALQDAGGYVISRQNNLELHLGCHTCWLSYFTLVCLSCGRTVGRAYGHVITQFSRMGRLLYFLTRGAPLRASRARAPLLISLQ